MLDLINPTTIVGGAIAIYEDVWDGLAEDIIILNRISSDPNSTASFEKAKIKSEQDGMKGLEAVRTNSFISLKQGSELNADLKNINSKFDKIIKKCLYSYRLSFDIHQPFVYRESNSLLKYVESQHFKSHYDGDTSSKRVVSPILYLNDNYEGGEIEFVNFGIKIKPKAGSLMVFPSNYAYRHIAHPVKSGTKYAIVTWIHDC